MSPIDNEKELVEKYHNKAKRFALSLPITRWYLARKIDPAIDMDDIIQAAFFGLIYCIRAYKPELNENFETLLYGNVKWKVVRLILRHSRGPISVSERTQRNLLMYQMTSRSLREKKHTEPEPDEVFQQIGKHFSPKDKSNILAALAIQYDKFDSFNSSDDNDDDGGSRFEETLTIQKDGSGSTIFNSLENNELSAESNNFTIVNELLKQTNMSDQERTIICRHFGLNNFPKEDMSEIAISFGVSRERIRVINDRALFKLKRTAKRLRVDITKAFIS